MNKRTLDLATIGVVLLAGLGIYFLLKEESKAAFIERHLQVALEDAQKSKDWRNLIYKYQIVIEGLDYDSGCRNVGFQNLCFEAAHYEYSLDKKYCDAAWHMIRDTNAIKEKIATAYPAIESRYPGFNKDNFERALSWRLKEFNNDFVGWVRKACHEHPGKTRVVRFTRKNEGRELFQSADEKRADKKDSLARYVGRQFEVEVDEDLSSGKIRYEFVDS